MRHPPAFQIDVRMGRAWRWALSMLTVLSAANLLWWLISLLRLQNASPIALALLIGSLALPAAYFSGRGLRRQKPRSLRWDGQIWLLRSDASPGGEERQGELRAMLDLGDWMLLRHTDLAPRRFRRGTRYLALSRADLPQQWHVLRGTLYSTADHTAVSSDVGIH